MVKRRNPYQQQHFLFADRAKQLSYWGDRLMHSKQSQWIQIVALFLLTVFLITLPGITISIPASQPTQIVLAEPDWIEQGKQQYEAGQLTDAVTTLQQAVIAYQNQGNLLLAAVASSNLSIVYQQLGQWDAAQQAIEQSVQWLDQLPDPDVNQAAILAQAYEIQGRLQSLRGQKSAAVETWAKAATLYQQVNDAAGVARSQLHQAEALQQLGLYRRSIDQLKLLGTNSDLPISLQIRIHRALGDALRAIGNLQEAETALQQSLTLAQQEQDTDAIAATQLSLANTRVNQGDAQTALSLYEQAIATGSPATQAQARLNQLRLLINTTSGETLPEYFSESSSESFSEFTLELIPQRVIELLQQIDRLPPGLLSVYGRVNLVQSLWQLADRNARVNSTSPTTSPISFQSLALILSQANAAAQQLNDNRAKSFVLGSLGELYEREKQFAEAQQFTAAALNLAQAENAVDAAYLWQWQLGRVLATEGKRQEAIAAYSEAISLLQQLRSDLVGINPEVQFSFREGVEPVYRQLVSLLLPPDAKPSPTELKQARRTIELLQLAELDNFFREACLNAQPIELEQVDTQAAVIYPILLPDRIEIILTLPNQEIKRYTTSVPEATVSRTVIQLQQVLRQVSANELVLPLAERMYEWLIHPLKSDLDAVQPTTLVFVLDGVLRNIPMTVLHDHSSNKYLIEEYAIALTPGLQLLESEPLPPERFGVLLGGLSESPFPDFSDLPGVGNEFNAIESIVRNRRILLNQQFTDTSVQQAIETALFPVVHLATHGEFSSRLEETFILTWNNRINITQLNRLLQATDIGRRRPIQLLVLSACETAEGDERAALGLAGVAVRAGARSTIATLWQLNDEAAPLLMQQLYEALNNGTLTKAQALQAAQLQLLNNPQYSLPYYWSAIVLIGSWL